MKKYQTVIFWLFGAFLLGGLGSPASAADLKTDDTALISFAAGPYDWNRQKEQGAEFRLEYRSGTKLWFFKPFFNISATSTSQGFIGAGVLIDVFLGPRLVVTPSFAPQFYFGGNSKLDLDYPLEFRSQLEIAYRFDNSSRLGLAVSHYSNASLGKTNPGTESAMIYYSVPFENLSGN